MPELTESRDITIEFEVYCDRCGAGLCRNTEVTVGQSRSIPQLRIEPCDSCLSKARDEGYIDGVAENA